MNRSCNEADKGCYFITSANLVVVEAKEEEKIADPCDRDKGWVFSNRKMSSWYNSPTISPTNNGKIGNIAVILVKQSLIQWEIDMETSTQLN